MTISFKIMLGFWDSLHVCIEIVSLKMSETLQIFIKKK
jgi:hypothetical protein